MLGVQKDGDDWAILHVFIMIMKRWKISPRFIGGYEAYRCLVRQHERR